MLQIITFLNCFFKFGLHVVNLKEQTEISFTSQRQSCVAFGANITIFFSQLPVFNFDKPNLEKVRPLSERISAIGIKILRNPFFLTISLNQDQEGQELLNVE